MKKNLLGGKIVEKYKIWFIVPLVILLAAMIVFTAFGINAVVDARKSGDSWGKAIGKGFSNGINIGIDFEGGTLLTVIMGEEDAINKFDENSKKISDIISSHGVNVSYIQKSNTGALAGIMFKYDALDDTTNDAILNDINAAYDNKFVVNEDLNYTTIGASASKDLIWTAVLSIVVSTLLILVYVIFRFELWAAFAAVIALIHDVLMMVCLTIIFHIQVNSSFIAAIITIVAYSINATIVLFDRVRENYKLHVMKGSDFAEYNRSIVNMSIKDTFTRNINTTLTTLVAITVLAIIGDMSIREFALPVIFGLILGAYSSLVISPSLFCLLKNRFSKEAKQSRGIAIRKPKKEKKAKVGDEIA